MAAISAHAPRAGTIEAYARALETGAEYVEFDIRRTRLSELLPMRRIRACRADWAAVNHRLARAGVLAQCHQAGIKAMIWTVDEDAEMGRWLTDPRVTVLITNRPADAVALRASLTQTALRPAVPQAP